jgi:uncharacterized SAM-binding protein YcdF (DUF218 family)
VTSNPSSRSNLGLPDTLKPVKLLRRSLPLLILLALAFALLVYRNYVTLPTGNTAATHFDTIIVLGYPANRDGTLSPEQRARVLEGIREYRAGVAPRLILTGGAAHNRFVEAHVMAQFAVSQGVPASDLFEEGQAQNTIQNIFYSAQIMHAHGWSSAEVVSSGYHLGRTALILTTFNRRQPALAFTWRTHAAPRAPEYTILRQPFRYSLEATRCLYYRLFGFPNSRFLPRPWHQQPATTNLQPATVSTTYPLSHSQILDTTPYT